MQYSQALNRSMNPRQLFVELAGSPQDILATKAP